MATAFWQSVAGHRSTGTSALHPRAAVRSRRRSSAPHRLTASAWYSSPPTVVSDPSRAHVRRRVLAGARQSAALESWRSAPPSSGGEPASCIRPPSSSRRRHPGRPPSAGRADFRVGDSSWSRRPVRSVGWGSWNSPVSSSRRRPTTKPRNKPRTKDSHRTERAISNTWGAI